MNTESAGYRELLSKRPLNVQAVYSSEPAALVSGRDIAAAAKRRGAIVLAANIRNPLTIMGVLRAAREKNAAVLLELAKSESTYCGCTFDNAPDMAVRFSAEMGHGVVFGMHVDHFAIKSGADMLDAVSRMPRIIERGWTSVAIDASHNPDWENLCYTRDLAMHIPAYIGLEAEVGEIKGPGEVTTVEEALYFVGGLNAWGVFPDYLAISNGSKHGTYDHGAGEAEGIDLERTLEVARAIEPYGVTIAQHGISGTPLDKVSTFSRYGVNKGNVGTLWQNIVFGLEMEPDTGNAIVRDGAYVKDPARGIPQDLWLEMVEWADSQGYSRKDGNYKKANKPFHDAIMALPQNVRDRIVDETAEWARRFIEAFHAEDTAELVLEEAASRVDHNSAPERNISGRRALYTADKAPDGGTGSGSEKDFSD